MEVCSPRFGRGFCGVVLVKSEKSRWDLLMEGEGEAKLVNVRTMWRRMSV